MNNNFKKILTFLALILFVLLFYNYVIKVKAFSVDVIEVSEDNLSKIYLIKPVINNELGFSLPFVFDEVDYSIIEGKEYILSMKRTNLGLEIALPVNQGYGVVRLYVQLKSKPFKTECEILLENTKV